MNPKYPKHSFEYRLVLDFYTKLVDEYKSLRRDPLSSRHAINFAMTAWHLTEWVWAQRLKENPKEQQKLYDRNFKNQKTFISHITSVCPDLGIIQAICNGSKHFTTTSPITQTSHRRSFRPARGFLCVEINSITKLDFSDIANTVYEFWHSKIRPPYGKIPHIPCIHRSLLRRDIPIALRDPNRPIKRWGSKSNA